MNIAERLVETAAPAVPLYALRWEPVPPSPAAAVRVAALSPDLPGDSHDGLAALRFQQQRQFQQLLQRQQQ